MKVRIDFTVFNLFNSAIATDKAKILLHPDDGQIQFNDANGDPDYTSVFKGFNTKTLMAEQGIRQNPLYGLNSAWQGPRSLRLRVSFVF
jgi:hypothetical protein